MLVEYKKPNVLNAAVTGLHQADKKVVTNIVLMPGVNELNDKQWGAVSALPKVKRLMDANELIVKSKVVGDDTATALNKIEDIDEACDVVRATLNHKLLRSWKESESRPAVIKTINQQIDMIFKKTSKNTTDG